MKLFKYTMILGTSLFIFSNTANAIFAVEHRSFSGNGDPNSKSQLKNVKLLKMKDTVMLFSMESFMTKFQQEKQNTIMQMNLLN